MTTPSQRAAELQRMVRSVPLRSKGDSLSRYQTVLIFLLVFTIPLRNLSLVELPGANLRIGDVVILGGLIIAHAAWLIAPAPGRSRSLDGALLAFLMLCLLSVAWSLDPGFGLARTFKYGRDLIFYFLLVQCLERDFRTGYKLLTAGAVASFAYIVPVAIYSLVRATSLDIDALTAIGLASTVALDPLRTAAIGGGTFAGTINDLGRWANVAFFLLLGTGFWTARGWILRWCCWAAAAVLVAVQAVSLSRATWLGFLVGGIWFWLRLHGRMRLSVAVRVGLVVAIVAALYWLVSHNLDQLLLARIRSTSEVDTESAITERFTLWQMGLSAFADRPLGGVGMGGGTVIAAATGVKDWYVHNVYIQMLFELGIAGAVVWGAVVWTWIWDTFRVRVVPLEWKDQLIAVAIQTAVLSLLVQGLTGTDFTELEYWIMLALAACLTRLSWTPVRSVPAARRSFASLPSARLLDRQPSTR
jgi:O-antigen ligase